MKTASRFFRCRTHSIICGAVLFIASRTGAAIVGPYTADANTLHLWHLDELAAPALDAVGNPPGTNCINLANTAALGSNSYAGFGTALFTGQNDSATATRSQFLSPVPGNPNTATGPFTFAAASGRAFTYEANVLIGFDPAKNLGTTADGGNNRNAPCQIMSIEGGSGARIFQFRIAQVGTRPGGGTNNPTVKLVPYLTFENVSGGQNTVFADIPTNGPDAIVSNQWYHVAVSYNGVPNTVNNLKFYWTLLNPTNTFCHQIPITSFQTNSSGFAVSSSTACSFEIGNQARNNNGNFLGSIDEVRMSSIERGPGQMMFTGGAVGIVNQPASQFVAAGDNVTLSVGAIGQALQYHWQFFGTNLPNATNSTLVLSNITFSQAGPYQVIVSNTFPSISNSIVATITVGSLFSELFNTGLSDNRALLNGGDTDPHYQLTYSSDPNYPGPAEVVVGATPASYLPNGPNSMWLAPVATGTAAGGMYTNRTTFLIDTMNPVNAVLSGSWVMDNQGLDILLNGVSVGATDTLGQSGFQLFTITNGFVPGLNTLDFAITNFSSGGINPTGWRFEMRGIGFALSNTAPFLTETDLPMNVTTQAQQSVSFSVAAAGSGPLSYQWYHGPTLLTGQTSRKLNLTAVTTADAGTYSVTITNGSGSTNASATLTVIIPPALVWLGNDSVNPTFWDTVTTNWLDTGSSLNVPFAQLDNVRFDDTGNAQPTVDLKVPLTPNTVTVDSTTNYTFMSSAFSGALGGAAILIKTNVGTLILDTVNSNSGPTTIGGGTLQVGNGDANGSLGTGPVNNNAALVFNRIDAFTVPNTISGTGTVTMAGSGTLGLTGNNNYSGPTVVSSGTLLARNNTALGTTNGGTTVASGGQLNIYGDVNIGAEPLTISGSGPVGDGALRKGAGSGTIFGGPITLAADAVINVDSGATLNLTNAAGITATDLNLTIAGAAANSRGTINGPISLGVGGVTQNNPGTWVLTATNNNWNGGTTINGGLLQIGDGGANGSIGGGAITLNGGSSLSFNSAANLNVTNPIQNDGNLLSFVGTGNYTVSGAIVNDTTNTYNNPGSILVSGTISGAGVINQNGTGYVTLTGTNASYSGITTIRGSAVLRPMNSLALGTGTCQIGSAQADTGRLELFGGLTLLNPITIFPRAFGTLTNPANILNVSGTNIVSPPSPILIPTGGNLLTLQSDSGRLIYGGGVIAGPGNNGRVLALRGAAAGEIQGSLANNGGASSLKVYKLDSGIWTLSATNNLGDPTADGGQAWTVISNGTLVVNGYLDNVVTNAFGTLTGTGALSGPVYISAGAVLAPGSVPGSSIGAMAVGALTLQSGSFTSMELNKSALTSDQVLGLTNVTYGGTLVLSNLAGALAANDSFKLFDSLAYSGSFSALSPTNPPGAGIRWNTNTLTLDGTLRILSTSPSQPGISSVMNAGGNIIIGGTNGSPWGSYAVLSTNNVAIPRTNWPVIATGIFDGSGHFNYTNSILPSGQRFFLLRAL
jgi:autotransporter-associated beta strand protein